MQSWLLFACCLHVLFNGLALHQDRVREQELKPQEVEEPEFEEDGSRIWKRGGRPPPGMKVSLTYWGHATCATPHWVDVGIRLKIHEYPNDMSFEVYPFNYFDVNDTHQYCRAVTSCRLVYKLKPTHITENNREILHHSWDSKPEHFDPETGNHELERQCDWPGIGLEFAFSEVNMSVNGNLTFSRANSNLPTTLKARTDLGQDPNMPPKCLETEQIILAQGGRLRCETFWMNLCKLTKPRKNEKAIFMILPSEATHQISEDHHYLLGKLEGDARLTELGKKHARNLLLNNALQSPLENIRPGERVEVIYLAPTVRAIETYLVAFKHLDVPVYFDPRLMLESDQLKLNRTRAIDVMNEYTAPSLRAKFQEITDFCADVNDLNFYTIEPNCGVDPSLTSISAMGNQQQRALSFKRRVEASPYHRIFVIGHRHIFEDARQLPSKQGNEAVEVRVLSMNLHWRNVSNPFCWDHATDNFGPTHPY